eukprot:379870-Rhodomonas_salina.4
MDQLLILGPDPHALVGLLALYSPPPSFLVRSGQGDRKAMQIGPLLEPDDPRALSLGFMV